MGEVAVQNQKHLFIVGTTFSGSTILYRLLCYHPDLAWFSQFSMRDGSIPGRGTLPIATTYDLLARRLNSHPWSKSRNAGLLTKVRAKMFPSPNEGGAIWNYALPNLKRSYYGAADAEQVRQRVQGIVWRALSQQGKERFLGKVPRLAQSLPALAEIFPNALFIHAVRDGKAVAVSPPPPYPRGSLQALKHIRRRALYWKSTIDWMERMERCIGENRVITVRYEDLCIDIRKHLSDVFTRSSLQIPKGLLESLPRGIRSTNAARLAATPSSERQLVEQLLGGSLPRLGYEASWDEAGAGAE